MASDYVITGSLMDHEWWTRVWTLQEMLLSRNKMVLFSQDTGCEICSLQEYIRIFDHYKKGGKKLPDHEIYAGTGTLCVRDVLAMCRGRRSTQIEDSAWGITGILNVKTPIVYGIGKHEAMKYLFKILAHRGDISFLDYKTPPSKASRSSFMPDMDDLEQAYLSLSPNAIIQCVSMAEIDDEGLHLKVSRLVSLNKIYILDVKREITSIAKRFLLTGQGRKEIYQKVLESIGTIDNLEDISDFGVKYYPRCKYGNAEIFSEIIHRYREKLQDVLTRNPNEKFFLANTASKDPVIGGVYLNKLPSKLYMASHQHITRPILLQHVEQETYRMVGRIKSSHLTKNKNIEKKIIIA